MDNSLMNVDGGGGGGGCAGVCVLGGGGRCSLFVLNRVANSSRFIISNLI